MAATMFDAPKANQFTQGTIFSCAYAEHYKDAQIYGLVITARCDAAQDKAPIYNFIPVVALTDWILKDGAEIILRRAISDAENTKKNIITQAGLAESLLRTKTSTEILSAHLHPKATTEKRFQQKINEFERCDSFITEAEQAIASRDPSITTTLKKCSKHIDTTIKELSGNRLLGYYLLRGMPGLYDTEGRDFVALLREIHHIPSSLAKEIVNGISVDSWEQPAHQPLAKCPAFHTDFDFCTPVARLKSPWMEHLMQSWTLLFARIGVEDIDASSVRKSLTSLGLELP